VKAKPTVGSPLFGEFPSDRISKATKEGIVHFFIHSFTDRDGLMMDNSWQSKYVNYTSEFRERFEAATYELPMRNDHENLRLYFHHKTAVCHLL
jgi:hypothetical protein